MTRYPTQVHGHRGCGGDMPANTIPAFIRAAASGCPWLELDVVITGDGQVVVSHEPWMDHRDCTDPDGKALTAEEGQALNLYAMGLAEIQRYRVIARGNGPSAPKPTLAEVVHAVDAWAVAHGTPAPGFNIEVKSEPPWYGTHQPLPAEFVELVVQQVLLLGIGGRCLVQSFDPAILRATRQLAPELPLALLVENGAGLAENLGMLDFKPDYYGPSFELIDAALVAQLRQRGIGVLAWTVNREADMQRMLDLGVEGLITDEPAKALSLLAGPH